MNLQKNTKTSELSLEQLVMNKLNSINTNELQD